MADIQNCRRSLRVQPGTKASGLDSADLNNRAAKSDTLPKMRRCIPLGLALLLLSSAVCGQNTATILKNRYSRASDGAFVIKPGVKIKVIDGVNVQGCVLIILGPISQQELMKTFDTIVPPRIRGSKKQDLVECAGPCERFIDFENVDFTSGVLGAEQTSDPDAVIVFKRKNCETAARQGEKTAFSIRKTMP
jgi:hypothetical protein